MTQTPLVNLTGGNLNDRIITGPGYVPIVPTETVPADVVASASQNRNTTPTPSTPNVSQPSPVINNGGSGRSGSGGSGGSGNSGSSSPVVSNPVAAAPSYDTVKGGIESNISSLNQNEIKVLLFPESAKFTDASGKEFSKQQALFEIEQGKKSLQGNLATIESYQSKGYHIRQGADGSFEFFKTPEEIHQENLSASESKLRSSMTGDAGQRVAGLGAWVTSGFLSWEDPFGIKSTAQVLMGDTAGAIKTKASAMYDLDTAISEGPAAYTLKVATGPFATVGTALVGGMGANAVEGRLAANATKISLAGTTGAKAALITAAPVIFKTGMIATGAVFGTMMAADVVETYKTDPLLALAKGVTYAGAIGAGVKGYNEMGGAKGITNKIVAAEDKFYEYHPERIRMVFMKQGVESSPFSWNEPEVELFASRGGSKAVSRLTMKGSKAWEPSEDWVAMSQGAADKIGPRLDIDVKGARSLKGADFFETEQGVGTRPLFKDMDLMEASGRTKEVKTGLLGRGRKIFDVGWKRLESSEDISNIERGGGGGVTKTKLIQVEDVGLDELGNTYFNVGSKNGLVNVPFVSGVSSGVVVGEIGSKMNDLGELQGPVFSGDLDVDLDLSLEPVNKPGFNFGNDTTPFTVNVVDTGFDRITGNDNTLDTFSEPSFDLITENVEETIPYFDDRYIPGFNFKSPGFSLTGFDTESGSLISLFGRHKEYRLGSLKKALNLGKEFKL